MDTVTDLGSDSKLLVPRIDSYPLPGAQFVSGNRVDWVIQPEKACLLVHDMQNYWVDRLQDPAQLISNCADLILRARKQDMLIVYCIAQHYPDISERGLAGELWGGGIPGDEFSQAVVGAISPQAGDLIVAKSKYSAFFRTPLEQELKVRGITQMIVSGIYAHHGCLLTAADAYMRDIKPIFVVDATADHSQEHHEMACRLIQSLCGINITTASAINQMSGVGPETTDMTHNQNG